MVRSIAIALSASLLLACNPDSQPDPTTLATDSAGIRITTSDATDRDADAVCSLAEAPDTRVASPSSGEWTIFEVEDLDRLEDGRLVVLNGGSRELLMFSRDGEFLRAIGRRGEGPGEFVDPESSMMGSPVFESKGVFSTHGDLLYTSDGSSPEVRLHRGERIEWILRWEPGDLSVRDEDVEAYRASYLEGTAGDFARLLRERLDAFPVKDAFPAVMEIQVDPHGRIWTRKFARPGATANEWLSFAETGEFICSLSVPRALSVFRFDSAAVVGVHRDEMGVESIEVTPFTFPG